MFRTRKGPVALMLVMSLLLNLMPVTIAYADSCEGIYKDNCGNPCCGKTACSISSSKCNPPTQNSSLWSKSDARRQTVQERTLNYSKGVDLIDVRQKIASTFKGNEGVPSKVFSQQAKANAKVGDCGGINIRRGTGCDGLNIPCCGEKECSLPCTANGALAHGDNKICLEKKQISDIYGRSCCGEADCYATDMNFRKDNCGGTGVGFTQTSKGYPCCGKEDCAQAECNYKTVTSGEHGGSGKAGITCCGYTDCHLKECDNKVSTKRKEDGSEVICCGEEDCKYAECDGLRSVDSKVFPDQKNIECCGKTDCHLKECDGKVKVDSKFDPNRKDIECCGEPNCYWESCDRLTVVQTDDGLVECCGQKDCDEKACGSYTSVKLPDGSTQVCCGKNDCAQKFAATLPDECKIVGDLALRYVPPLLTDHVIKFSEIGFGYYNFAKRFYIQLLGCGNAICSFSVDDTLYWALSTGYYDNPMVGPFEIKETGQEHVFYIKNSLAHEGEGLAAGWAIVCASYH